MISKHYKFYVDGETTEQQLRLPGRVFKHQLVESSPNVEYYSNKEYPQRKHAFRCQIRAALALPVFEPTDHTCVGVLELLYTTRDAFLIFLEEGARSEMFKSMGTPVHGNEYLQTRFKTRMKQLLQMKSWMC
ncbi:protein NLP6-like isoform X4 [Camellia sinensis]|uniref:protein NLP6-like isoform X4 n=1 Tax=Camellia sinensis TaxID=4442 RepID=UPI001036D335|nr:protein NLP6-like isoform X4 [Camellia sinensis]